MRTSSWWAAAFGLLALWLPSASTAESTSTAPAPGLALEAVTVEPDTPKADTLCRLRVRIQNSGQQAASHLVFQVQAAGHELPVYRNLVYLQPLPPSQTTEVRLRNFWSSETGRPFPVDGKLTVRVTLQEARWVQVSEKDGATTTTPLGVVQGLPVQRDVAVPR